MRRIQSIGHFRCQGEQFAERKRPAVNEVSQRGPFEELHHKKGPVDMAADLVNGADIWVIQSGGRPRLPTESLERIWVSSQIFGKELHCDETAEVQVLGLINHTHAAASNPAEDSVVAQNLAGQVIGRIAFRHGSSYISENRI